VTRLALLAATVGAVSLHCSQAATNVVLWDTLAPMANPAELASGADWKRVPSNLLTLEADPPKASSDPGYYGREYAFQGDAVVENSTFTAVFWSAKGRVILYSKGDALPPGGPAKMNARTGRKIAELAPLQTRAQPMRIRRCDILRNAGDEVVLEVTFAAMGSVDMPVVFSFGKTEIVQIQPVEKMEGLRLFGPIEYGIVPGFIGDDLILNAAQYPGTNTICLPAENVFLGLLPGEENPTPLVRLTKVVPYRHTRVYAKLEWYNPFGAVKDRIAANLLDDAEKRGLVAPGAKKLVEPTSGNTGLGLAMMANAKGYSVHTPLSNKIPLEKRAVLRFFGAEVLELDDELCPAPGAPEGAIAVARQTANMPEFHMLDQYRNEANPESHYKTTGPEIWKQTGGKITHFAAGLGTCGTITGTGRFLKEKNRAVQVLGVHPGEGHDIPGVRSIVQLRQTELFRPQEYDRVIEVSNEEAYALCHRLVREECVIAGPSSGMALAGALKMVPDAPGHLLVVIFPDNIFKYASSVMRHFPELFPAAKAQAPAASELDARLYDEMVRNAKTSRDAVPVDEAKAILDRCGAVVIDVRQPERFEAGHVTGAMNIPLADLGGSVASLPTDKDQPILCVCERGNISANGMIFLKALGYSQVKRLSGGTRAWIAAGYPTEP